MNEKVKIANDQDFYNIWRGHPGVIIGSGIDGNYLPVNSDIAKFEGKIIGCSEACQYYHVDLAIWVDALVQDEFKPFWEALSAQDCLKMSIAADPPGQFPTHGNDITWLRAQPPERFSPSFDLGFYPADSTGYLAFNVALLLGCNPLWLVGFDSWKHPYFPKSRYYTHAKKWLEQHGRSVYTADSDSFFCHGDNPIFEYKPLPLPNQAEEEE